MKNFRYVPGTNQQEVQIINPATKTILRTIPNVGQVYIDQRTGEVVVKTTCNATFKFK